MDKIATQRAWAKIWLGNEHTKIWGINFSATDGPFTIKFISASAFASKLVGGIILNGFLLSQAEKLNKYPNQEVQFLPIFVF